MVFTSPYGAAVPPLPEANVHHLLFHRAEQLDPASEWAKDYTLHIEGGRRTSYLEFRERVSDGATALSSLGLNTSSMVGILSENSSEYIALLHSLLSITAPFALLSSYSTPFELTHAMRLAQVTHLFVQPRLMKLATQAAKEAGLSQDRIFLMDAQEAHKRSFGRMIKAVRSDQVSRVPVSPATKDTLAYLIFSSGTSGLPKAVMITHGNIAYASMQLALVAAEMAKVHQPPRLNTPEGIPVQLAFLPFHHSFGLLTFCLRQFLARATVVIMPSWEIQTGLSLIKRHQVSSVALVPSIVHQICHHPGVRQSDLSSIKWVGCGAAYLPKELADKFKGLLSTDMTFTDGYGLSEATVGAIARPFPGVLGGVQPIPGSSGILYPGVEARIVDENEQDVPMGEIGELWLKGPNVSPGYWNNTRATQNTFVNGWLKTGDRFRVDATETFYFEDRAKDTLKISGMQVSPVEIENVLMAQPDGLISDCTVAGVNGGRTSDEKVPRAWIVLSEVGRSRGHKAVKSALNQWVEVNLSKYKHLRGGISIIDSIPKSPTGKVLRRVLVEKHEQKVAAKL